MNQAISIEGMCKSYGPLEAVRGIDLEVTTGKVLALLGPNGAGKTTTVEILEGYRRRDAGRVEVLGVDPERGGRQWRARIGIVLQECAIDPYLTVSEVIAQRRRYYAASRPVGELLELVGLDGKASARVKGLSGGQQRRLDLALALAGDPELIFLDEPTTGFDPSARRSAWEIVRGLAALGKTILLTTHYMDEAQALADRVAIMNRGTIVAEGPPGSLGHRDRAATVIRFRLPEHAAAGPGELPPLGALTPTGTPLEYEMKTLTPTIDLNVLTGWAVARSFELEGLCVSQPSLEDVYLQLTSPEPEASAP